MTTIRNVFDIVPEEVRTAFDGDPHLTKPRPAKQSEAEPVTIERLERGLALMAYLVVVHGPVLAPLFEKLERNSRRCAPAKIRSAARSACSSPTGSLEA
jgi:hypothetical protein